VNNTTPAYAALAAVIEGEMLPRFNSPEWRAVLDDVGHLARERDNLAFAMVGSFAMRRLLARLKAQATAEKEAAQLHDKLRGL